MSTGGCGPGWAELHERELRTIDGLPPELDGTPGATEQGVAGAEWSFQAPPEERIGLALSGGGIRSATFNLGVLQKLAGLGVLPALDYLSTISGGGYIGAFWSAWKARRRDRDDPFPLRHQGGAEPPEVRHLREFSNFLRPRPKLLSSETGNMASSVVAALLPSITVALSLLVLALTAWLAVARLLLGEPPGSAASWLLPPAAIVTATLLVQAVFEALWRHRSAGRPEPREPPPDESSEGREERRYPRGRGLATAVLVLAALLAAVVAGTAWAVLWHLTPLPFESVLRPLPSTKAIAATATLLLPALAWVAAIGALVLVRVLASRRVTTWHRRRRKAALDRALSRVILCAAGWAVVGIVWVLGQLVAAEGIGAIATLAGSGGAAGGLFAWGRRLLGAQPNRPSGGKLRRLAGPWLLTALAYAVVAAAGVATAALLAWLGPAGMPWAVGAAGVVVLVALVFFDPHQNGFHSFYRQRLVRAFLGASNDTAEESTTTEQEGDDLAMDALPSKPLHLVCCAANDLSADPLGTLHRGAVSAVLSRQGLQVGSSWHSWSEVKNPPSLGSAMTASAAAFNSQMGSRSVQLGPAATFLLGALNLRLGRWEENPAAHRTPLVRVWTRLQRLLPGLLYLRELTGASRARSTWIHLSDGAHFENLALYELVRRHCRCILLSDCGADPDVAFDDFGNAVRRIREDFGVEIDINLAPLRPGEDGTAAQPMVAGDIRYPTGDLGVLLYIKPTLVGDEPADIAQYARRNETFPHETTLDQFYDEAQWEAYRRLGEHVAERALGGIASRLAQGRATPRTPLADAPLERGEVVRLFLHARYAWPPDGGDDAELTDSVERGWTRLESRLDESGVEVLRRQLLPTAEKETVPSDEDCAHALPLVREALRLMETTVLETGLAASPHAASHPRYMGWLNRFGRWASAPLFRAWWPWLAPVHSQHLREFLQGTFGLEPVAHPDATVQHLRKAQRRGYTWSRWSARSHRSSRPTEQTEQREKKAQEMLYGFFVPMPSSPTPELLAGIAAVRIIDDRQRDARVAAWDQEDFFVPPGLWGVGLGEELLKKLVEKLQEKQQKKGKLERIAVTSSEDLRSMAWEALYTGAGFRREGGELVLDLTPVTPDS